MRRMHPLLIVLVASALCLAEASTVIPIPSPYDEQVMKRRLNNELIIHDMLTDDRELLSGLEKQLRGYKESELSRAFGQPIPLTDAYSLPFARLEEVTLHQPGDDVGNRSYFLPIANLAGLLVYPANSEEYPSAVVLYLKTDDNFIMVTESVDYFIRHDWEQEKLAKLEILLGKLLSHTKTNRPEPS